MTKVDDDGVWLSGLRCDCAGDFSNSARGKEGGWAVGEGGCEEGTDGGGGIYKLACRRQRMNL